MLHLYCYNNTFRKSVIDTHGGSLGHRNCMDAYNAKKVPQETPMARLCRKLTSQQRDKLVYLFNTAHSVAMHNWSLKDFKPLCELQVKNEVLMGDNYLNHVDVTNFINSIVEVQWQDTMGCLAQFL